jgi:cystathionine gamma-lyase
MADRAWGDGTRAIHAGLPEPEQGAPFLPGPQFASPYHLSGDPDGVAYDYNRYGNPTWTAYERALSELEGGEALVFSSGMAAVTAALLPFLVEGGAVVVPRDGYPGVRELAREQLAPRGVDVRLVPTEDGAIRAALEGAALVWLETPTNPGLDVCDIAALAGEAHAAGALVAVDNTLATPLGQRPLALGADFSVSSATKHLTGHSDVILGYAATRDPERAEALRGWRTHTGAIAGPLETWLAHRSLATLDVRLRRQCANAQGVAELLAARGDLAGLRYPGLESDPAHALAARQMDHFGSVIGFVLEDAGRARRFLDAAELVIESTSFGGVHTSAERRARWGTDDVPEGFIRLSLGIEDLDDLRADIEHALDVPASGS